MPLLCQGGRGQHAELFLLEHIHSRNLDQKLSYKVTCFLSWTPCEKCAEEIIRFLAKNRHVSLSILASRIYTMGPYVKGLRRLYDAGVHISIMTFRGQRGPPGGTVGRERPGEATEGWAGVVSLAVAPAGCLRGWGAEPAGHRTGGPWACRSGATGVQKGRENRGWPCHGDSRKETGQVAEVPG